MPSVLLARGDTNGHRNHHRVDIPYSPALATGVPSIPDTDQEGGRPFLDSESTPTFTPEPEEPQKPDPVKRAAKLAPPRRSSRSRSITPNTSKPPTFPPPKTPKPEPSIPRKILTPTPPTNTWSNHKKTFTKLPAVDVRESQAYLKRNRGEDREEEEEDSNKRWVGGTGRKKKPMTDLKDISPASPPTKKRRRKRRDG